MPRISECAPRSYSVMGVISTHLLFSIRFEFNVKMHTSTLHI